MLRDSNFTAFVLQKQPFGEADELITFFTKEAGKLRALAKSTRRPASKLAPSLQKLFLTQARLSGKGSLPTLVSSRTINSFAPVFETDFAMVAALSASERVLKATADGQQNFVLFEELRNFLGYAAEHSKDKQALAAGLIKFSLNSLSALGFAILPPKAAASSNYFSNSYGGFSSSPAPEGAYKVSAKAELLFSNLSHATYTGLAGIPFGFTDTSMSELQQIVGQFFSYQIERKLYADVFFSSLNS